MSVSCQRPARHHLGSRAPSNSFSILQGCIFPDGDGPRCGLQPWAFDLPSLEFSADLRKPRDQPGCTEEPEGDSPEFHSAVVPPCPAMQYLPVVPMDPHFGAGTSWQRRCIPRPTRPLRLVMIQRSAGHPTDLQRGLRRVVTALEQVLGIASHFSMLQVREG